MDNETLHDTTLEHAFDVAKANHKEAVRLLEQARAALAAGDVGDRIDLERAVAALPPNARTVFVLHDVEGYRHDEIATRMQLAPGTVRAHLHRARKLLMGMLQR